MTMAARGPRRSSTICRALTARFASSLSFRWCRSALFIAVHCQSFAGGVQSACGPALEGADLFRARIGGLRRYDAAMFRTALAAAFWILIAGPLYAQDG